MGKTVQSREVCKNRLRAESEWSQDQNIQLYETMYYFPLSRPQHYLFFTWSHVCVLAEMCKLPHSLPSTYTGQHADCSVIRWKKGETVSDQQGRTWICVLGPGSLHFEQLQLTTRHAVINKVLAQTKQESKDEIQAARTFKSLHFLITPT